MKVKPIRTRKEHKAALLRIQELFDLDPKEGSAAFDELELLTMVVEEYEDIHYPVPPPDPIEAIKFRLDQLGLSEKDLDKWLGSRQRRSEILSGKRKLSLSMIRTLHKHLRIPAETLIREYTVKVA
ncbi:MAG TPA: transcriptional regulator [Flavobacteriales bacterium]|nr:transcriptional regulator [Flavobacteriales bacterium]HMR27820.1 transcriptional regulator [Flavobacteriales bacterium]